LHAANEFDRTSFGSNPSTSYTNFARAVKCCLTAAPLQSVEKGMPISRATSTRSRTRPTYQSLGLVPLFRLSAVPAEPGARVSARSSLLIAARMRLTSSSFNSSMGKLQLVCSPKPLNRRGAATARLRPLWGASGGSPVWLASG